MGFVQRPSVNCHCRRKLGVVLVKGSPLWATQQLESACPDPRLPAVSSFPPCLQVPRRAAAAHPCSQPGTLLLAVFLQLLHFGAAAKVQGGLKPDTSKTVLLPAWRAVCHISSNHLHLSDIQRSSVLGKHWCVCPQAGRWKVSNQCYPAALLVWQQPAQNNQDPIEITHHVIPCTLKQSWVLPFAMWKNWNIQPYQSFFKFLVPEALMVGNKEFTLNKT